MLFSKSLDVPEASLKSGVVSLARWEATEGMKQRLTGSELRGREFTWVLCPEETEEGQGWERRGPSGDSGESQGKDRRGLSQEAGRDTPILENAGRMAPQVGRKAVQKGGKPLVPHSEGPDVAKGLEGRASLDACMARRALPHPGLCPKRGHQTVGWPRP